MPGRRRLGRGRDDGDHNRLRSHRRDTSIPSPARWLAPRSHDGVAAHASSWRRCGLRNPAPLGSPARSTQIASPLLYLLPVSDTAPEISFRAELGRKALHLGALVIPLGILLLDGNTVASWPLSVVILVPLAALALVLDVARVRSSAIRDFLHRWFGWMMRPEEVPPLGGPITFNGATMMCTSAALCAALFPAGIAAAAVAILMVGDAAAALVGRRFGKIRWPGSPEAVEGSLGYAVTAFGIGLAAFGVSGIVIGPIVAGFFLTVWDVFAEEFGPVDDTVTIAGIAPDMALASPMGEPPASGEEPDPSSPKPDASS